MACIRVVAQRGFARTRMSDIADEIGVTAPLLLHYFGSKNELITEALVASDEAYLDRVHRRRFAAGERPERLVVRYVEDSVWPAPAGRAWWGEASAVWMNAWITALHDPSIARVRAAEDRRWRAALAEVVAKGQEDGAFRAEVDAQTSRAHALRAARRVHGAARAGRPGRVAPLRARREPALPRPRARLRPARVLVAPPPERGLGSCGRPRAWCNGCTRAFQALSTGSIPVARFSSRAKLRARILGSVSAAASCTPATRDNSTANQAKWWRRRVIGDSLRGSVAHSPPEARAPQAAALVAPSPGARLGSVSRPSAHHG